MKSNKVVIVVSPKISGIYVGKLSIIFLLSFVYGVVFTMRHNVLGLWIGRVSEHKTVNLHWTWYEAQSYNFARHPAWRKTRVGSWRSCPPSLKVFVRLGFMCHCPFTFFVCLWRVVRGVFYFFEALENFLRTILSALAKQTLLQFLVCALACANCKCACF